MKRITTFLIIVFLVSGLVQSQILEEKQHLYKVYFDRVEQIQNLEKTGISIYNFNPEGFIEVLALPDQAQGLTNEGFQVEFIAPSFKALAEAQAQFKASPEYHDYQETLDELDHLAATYPNITELTIIGQSVAGRSIACIKVSDNANDDEDEVPILIVGNHHGNEVLGVEATLYNLNYLLENYGTDAEVTYWVDHTEIWFVPMMNPDGREAVRRTNNNGVDLNRNYSFEHTATGNHGSEGFSEPETRAIRDLAAIYPPALSLTYHTSGRYVLYSWTHTDDAAPDSAAMIYLGNKVAESIIFPSGSGTDDYLLRQGGRWYFTQGEYCDYMYATHNTLGFTIEMWTSQNPDGSVIPQVVERNLEGFKTMLRQAFKAGVTGLITDINTGESIEAEIDIPAIDNQGKLPPRLAEADFGRYYRYLEPGSYQFSFSAPGYRAQVHDVIISETELTSLDIFMQPGPMLDLEESILIDESQGAVIGNGNGAVNLGETIGLKLSLTNSNDVPATGAWIQVSSESSYLNLISDSLYLGTVPGLGSTLSEDTLLFQVSADCPDGELIVFDLMIADADGPGWMSSFTVDVYAPNVSVSVTGIQDDNGNQNGVIDAGETVFVELRLQNSGRQGVGYPELSITTNDEYFTVLGESQQIFALDAGMQYSFFFEIALGSNAPVLHVGDFFAHLNSSEGYAPDLTFRLSNIDGFFDDFENGINGWSHYTYGSTSNPHDDWQLGTPQGKAGDPDAAYSGLNCWGTDLGYELYEGENWNGEYQSSVFNYLRSPAIDCSNLTGVGLQFQRILNLRTNDVGRVLVNDQVVWETPRRGFSESEWTQERIDISDLADGQSKVVVSFDLRSNNTTNLGGWNIDDFILAGNLFSSSAAVTDVLPTDALGEAFPNPFVDRVEIPFSISRNAWVEIAIFDHFGRIVKTLINKRMPAGQHQLSWDGTNEGGEKLAQGLYYCQFKTDGFQETQRLLFFR